MRQRARTLVTAVALLTATAAATAVAAPPSSSSPSSSAERRPPVCCKWHPTRAGVCLVHATPQGQCSPSER